MDSALCVCVLAVWRKVSHIHSRNLGNSILTRSVLHLAALVLPDVCEPHETAQVDQRKDDDGDDGEGGGDVEAGEDDDGDEDGGEGHCEGAEGEGDHVEVLLVERVEHRVGEHVDLGTARSHAPDHLGQILGKGRAMLKNELETGL